MISLKGIILSCITFLVTVGVVITYLSQQDRYALYPHEKGIFVFDRKTATLNFCDSQICQMIRPVLPSQDSEVVMSGMGGIPAQNSIVNGSIPMTSSAMVPQGGVMQSMTAQPMVRQPSPVMAQQPGMTGTPQQTPIQVVSPLPTAPSPAPATPAAAPAALAVADATKDKKATKSKKADKASDASKDKSSDEDDQSDDTDSDDSGSADSSNDSDDSSSDDSSDETDDNSDEG